MRYGEADRESDQVEDRRGRGGIFPGGGGGVVIPVGGGRGLGLGWILLIGLGLLLLGINPLALLTGGGLQIPDLPRPSAQRMARISSSWLQLHCNPACAARLVIQWRTTARKWSWVKG